MPASLAAVLLDSEINRLRVAEISKYLTHVNTLSAGSIVVLATFADKFDDRGHGWLLAAAAIGFAAAIGASLTSYYSLMALAQAEPGDFALVHGSLFGIGFKLAGGLFAFALACLALFAVIAVW